jgi:O-antigen ligase/tetratricopeptide (TPR) repeat protein
VTPERLRAAIRVGIYALVLLAPLPFGSVEAGYVLAIELIAAAIGVASVALIALDPDARQAVPRVPLALCGAIFALGLFQVVPLPFSIAETFNPTAELVRPLIPYLGFPSPPAVSWSVAAPETVDAILRFVAYLWIGLGAALAFDAAEARRRFAIVLVASAVFQAVYGSGEYLTGRQHIFAFAKKHYLDSATGTFINRNHFATFLAMALPFALALAIPPPDSGRTPSGWRKRVLGLGEPEALTRALAIAAAALIWLGLLLSQSRAGLIASVLGAGIVLHHHRRARVARWATAVGMAVLVVLLSLEVTRAPGQRFLEIKGDITLEGGRLTAWRDSLELVTQRPLLGWGLGTFGSAFSAVQSAKIRLDYGHAHNDWLECVAEGGGMLGALTFALAMVFAAAGRRVTRGNLEHASIAVAAFAAGVVVMTHAIWDFPLRIPVLPILVAAGFGLLWSAARASSARQHLNIVTSPAAISTRGRPRVSVLISAGLFVLLGSYALECLAHHHWDRQRHGGPGQAELRAAMTAFADPSSSPAAQLNSYRAGLMSARDSLQRSIRSRPIDSTALLRLAAVFHEQHILLDVDNPASPRLLVEIAATRAPFVASIQCDAGQLLYRMGEAEAGHAFMRRAVELAPWMSNRVVASALSLGIQPLDALRELPPIAPIFAALKEPLLSVGGGGELLRLLEQQPSLTAPELVVYGEVARRLREDQRLVVHLEHLGTSSDQHAEAERQFQMASSLNAEGASAAAVTKAELAFSLWNDPRYCELRGQLQLSGGDPVTAGRRFEECLERASPLDPSWRAKLYRGLGQSAERNGEPDVAFEYYRRALLHDPEEPIAGARMRELQSLRAPRRRVLS